MSVEVRKIDSRKGFGLFATCQIKCGDIIFKESPVFSSQFLWNQLYGYKACDFCMRALESAEEMVRRLSALPHIELPHLECCPTQKHQHVACQTCQLEYCCIECRDNAWHMYHRTICAGQQSSNGTHPLISLCETWRNFHYPPESCSIMLIVKLLATIKQSSDPWTIINKLSEFCKLTINEEEQISHKLLGPQFQNQLDLLREMLRDYLYVREVDQWYTAEGFRSLFALIGTNGQGIGTSSFSVWVKNIEALSLPKNEKKVLNKFIDKIYEDIDKVAGSFLDCEGSGLYSLQSKCNHSCAPNAEVTFPSNNSTLSVVSLQDIQPQEEILISYLGTCDLDRSRHSRHKILRENYLFNCDCSKCREDLLNQPDQTSEEEDDDDDNDDDENDDSSSIDDK